ncbi:OmpA family protein [Echinicola rosea]|nr:OmpA family protein [Echinicola rosea]
MMKNYTLLLTLFLSCAFWSTTNGQNALLRYADEQSALANYAQAVEGYTRAFERRKTYRSAKGAAECYAKSNNYAKAYEWWGKAMEIGENPSVDDAENYLKSSYAVGKEDDALKKLRQLGLDPSNMDPLDLLMYRTVSDKAEEDQLELAAELNTLSAADFMGARDGEGNLYFVSDRDTKAQEKSFPGIRFDARNQLYDKEFSDWTGREYLKIYKKDPNGAIIQLQMDRDDFLNVSDPSIVKAEGKEYLFFSATRSIRKAKQKRTFTVSPEIFYGELQGDKVANIKSFPFNSTLEHGMVTPFVDQSAERLYFASDMEGGHGGYDIYYVGYSGDFEFGEPVNVGEPVNSAGDERDPFVDSDKFFFASNGHQGHGGLDVYQVDLQEGSFSDIAPLDEPYNSSKDDFAYRQYPDNEIYLSSNRRGDSGLDNIYRQVARALRKLVVSTVDCNGLPVKGARLMVQNEQGEQVEMAQEDEGVYSGVLSGNTEYELELTKKGYFSVEDLDITTKGTEPGTIEREYRLVPVPDNRTVYVDIIYYDLDKSSIREDASKILDRASKLLKEYPFLRIKVSAHTDSRASRQYNVELSRQRAENVKASLVGRGVDAARIAAEWHGEEQLVNDCADGDHCPEGLHQLNRRTELVISLEIEEGMTVPGGMLPEDWCNKLQPMQMIEEYTGVPMVHFDFDRTDLRVEDKMELERLVLLLENNDDLRLELQGHTDIRGSEAYNKELSEERAGTVAQYLIDRGINKGRLDYSGLGESSPVEDCKDIPCSEEIHQLNRRTEIKVKQ